MADTCACGSVIVQPPTGRRRKRCAECAPSAKRRDAPAPVLAMPTAEPGTSSGRSSLADATRADLTAAGRLDSTNGVAALGLAELFDAGGYTAQGAAALIKAHREALAVALEGAGEAADVIDVIFGTGS